MGGGVVVPAMTKLPQLATLIGTFRWSTAGKRSTSLRLVSWFRLWHLGLTPGLQSPSGCFRLFYVVRLCPSCCAVYVA